MTGGRKSLRDAPGRSEASPGRPRDGQTSARNPPRALPGRSRGAPEGSPGAPGRSRHGPERSEDAADSVRMSFYATFACAPVVASICGRFFAISTSRAGGSTRVSYAFLQVQTHVAPFALRERVRSGNDRKTIEKHSEKQPEIASASCSSAPGALERPRASAV